MERGAVVIIERGELMLIKRVRGGRTYYLFPGGGVEPGETPEQAAVREAFEELGLDVDVGQLVAVVEHDGNQQYYFLATVTGGQFGTGTGAEMGSAPDSTDGSFRPVRLPIRSLPNRDVRPAILADAIYSDHLPESGRVLHIKD